MRTPRLAARNPSPGSIPRWDAARARRIDRGLRRMAERGVLSETDRKQLAARVDRPAAAPEPGVPARHEQDPRSGHAA